MTRLWPGLLGVLILSGVGHSLRLVLAWLRILLRLILLVLYHAIAGVPALKSAS